MGSDADAQVLHQVAAGVGFADEDVQRRAAHLTAVQRREECILVDDAAAAGVSQDYAVLHLGQFGRTDQVAAGYVDGDVVGFGQHLVHGHYRNVDGHLLAHQAQGDVLAFLDQVYGQDVHAQADANTGGFHPDATEAENAQRLTAQLLAAGVRLFEFLELGVGRPHLVVSAVDAPAEAEEVSEDQFGYGRAGGGRRVVGRDALRLSVSVVDVVDPHAAAADHLQVRAGVDQVLTHLGGGADDDNVEVVELGHQLVLGNVVGDNLVAGGFELGLTVGGDAVVGENADHWGCVWGGAKVTVRAYSVPFSLHGQTQSLSGWRGPKKLKCHHSVRMVPKPWRRMAA